MRHPAIPIILDAEQTPVFRLATAPVDARLAVASQLAPETLPPEWIARLALRYAEVLVQAGDLDRAKQWLKVAARDGADDRLGDVRRSVLEARCAIRGENLGGAQAALRGAISQLAPLEADPVAHARARLWVDLATAELQIVEGRFGAVITLLDGRVRASGVFTSQDDVWRAHTLLGKAYQARLAFARAADLLQAVVDQCRTHDAAQDEADALVALGQCLLAEGDQAGALAAFERARSLAAPGHAIFKGATAALVTGRMATGDLDGAIQAAQRAGIEAAQADDARTYLEAVGLVTHLLRLKGDHKQAYRTLLGVYGQLRQRFGDPAAAPALALIELLQRDLGPARFEALAAELVAELSG